MAERHARQPSGSTTGPPIVTSSDPDALSRAVRALRAGHIVGLPTETVYGVAVLPEPRALSALMSAKGRAPDKGIAVLVDDLRQVEDLVDHPSWAIRLAQRFWPGALTMVLPLRPGVVLPRALTGDGARLGVRVPDHPVPRALARILGPLAVTSANRSGEREALSAQALVRQLGPALALVIDGGPVAGPGVPSTVVAAASDGRLEVLRPGAIPASLLLEVAAGVA